MTADAYFANGNEVQLFEQAYHQRLPGDAHRARPGAARHGWSSTWALLLRPTRRHHQLPRRPHQLRPRRPLHGDRRRRGVDRRAAHPGGQGRRDLLPRRGRGGTPRLAGHPALADRPPPRPVPGPRRRGRRGAGDFMLVCSYNPAYRSSLKELKPSFRQRFVTLADEVPAARPRGRGDRRRSRHRRCRSAQRLVQCATAIRTADEAFHFEPPSTRVLVTAAQLIAAGASELEAAEACILAPLSTDGADHRRTAGSGGGQPGRRRQLEHATLGRSHGHGSEGTASASGRSSSCRSSSTAIC